ncbi:MAG TPA: antitoxin Xre/MbcA/ParS toxin-binding domain-containing protein [Anaerolineales bacterium]|nr:antitoxin Xre/MbcA/ParS toxin-binding domain-containing protein [Anaerolineales bacterium]
MTDSLVRELELSEARTTFAKFRDEYEWDNADLAAALQVDRRTVQRYRSGASYPTRRVRSSIADLRELAILLDEIFADDADALRWLNKGVPVLKGRRPIDLIKRGKLSEVVTALNTYHSGAFR